MTTPSETSTHASRDNAFPRPLPPGPEDLVILSSDDQFYLLKKEAYQNADHEIRTSMVSQVQLLVDQGVALADIPVGSIPGVGAMCYLVNLSGFGPRESGSGTDFPSEGRLPIEPAPIDPQAACLVSPAPATDDLIIHDREGKGFYWVKKCEYERPETRLDQLEPILEQQVRLLTNQGVVIADVPGGGKLLGVDDMGVLVNLKRIPHPPPPPPEAYGAL
ncbi:hypothetical protein [Pyxidicoccus trucidator]|uniref:hypothetical protein n=1 Tax=Pyxidicoccus trucidator TaxID=2709662 RepID=UPI0013DCCC22|nr:hypothetical protein [Pyxidicoccus trucidator]